MRRLRVLRRLLVKYRAAGKIDKHLYHELYHLSKGNTFKHKRALVEHVSRITTPKSQSQETCKERETNIFCHSRSTRQRQRQPVRSTSRTRWTPSAQRPRPPARGSKREPRPSRRHSLERRRRRQSKGNELQALGHFVVLF